MFEALTGTTPFCADSPAEMMLKHVSQSPSQAAVLAARHQWPVKIFTCVLGCIEKDPELRPDSAASLKELLKQALEATPSEKCGQAPHSVLKRSLVITCFLSLLFLFCFGVFLLSPPHPALLESQKPKHDLNAYGMKGWMQRGQANLIRGDLLAARDCFSHARKCIKKSDEVMMLYTLSISTNRNIIDTPALATMHEQCIKELFPIYDCVLSEFETGNRQNSPDYVFALTSFTMDMLRFHRSDELETWLAKRKQTVTKKIRS